MMKIMKVKHEFVKSVPQELEKGTVYVSIDYATVIHQCCCGCGGEVVTPLSPTDWHLSFDGQTVSLYPSIGNWSFPCQSHYWIRNNQVVWAPKWSKDRIERNRQAEIQEKQAYFKQKRKRALLGFLVRKDNTEKDGE